VLSLRRCPRHKQPPQRAPAPAELPEPPQGAPAPAELPEPPRYFACSGGVRAPPNPIIPRLLDGASQQKNTLFIEFWRGSGGSGRVKIDAPPVHIWCFLKHMFLLVFLPLLDDREDESEEAGYFSKADPPLGVSKSRNRRSANQKRGSVFEK